MLLSQDWSNKKKIYVYIFNVVMVGYEDGNGSGDDGCSSCSWKE